VNDNQWTLLWSQQLGQQTVDVEKTAGHKLVREFSSDVLRRPRFSSELLLSALKQVSGDVLSTSISDGVLLRLQEDDNALRFH
jgi:hypothetical protein